MHINRILAPPNTSFFLLGPRGTGKSTWLKRKFPDARYIDLLSETTYQRLLINPGLFGDEIRSFPPASTVIVDEIQRLPNLLNEVHRAIEEQRHRFVLCGSSARKLNRSGVNLLAGRALRRAMHPFLPEELGSHFDLASSLKQGLLPIIWDSIEPEETLRAYAQMYLKEEIQAEALVRNLPGFARFLPIAALMNGQIVNLSNVAREAGVARPTAAGYFEILEETLLCFRVPAYEAKLRVRERKQSKWYWCDPGLVRAMKQSALGDPTPEERGSLFEGLVAQMIRAYRDYRGLCENFFYWAPVGRSTVEVDFLIKRADEFVAIEVKSGARFSNQWCRGLRVIKDLKGMQRRIIAYPSGPRLKTADGIDVLSLSDLSELLSTNSLWP